jgi:hypothetical protein
MKNAITLAQLAHEYCLIVYLDIEGAFDSVWHDGLLFKLHSVGVGDQMLAWLYSYFQNRTVQVQVGVNKSEPKSVRVGVPQGAVLSPTLFNVMLHDLPLSPRVKLVGYADDITLFVNGHSLIEARGYMQRYLDEIGKWCTRWQLKLNPARCSYQVFTSCCSTPAVSLRVSNRNIQYVVHQKVLRFYFDSPHLNFKEHVRQTRIACLKRLQVLRALSSVKWGALRQLLRRIYVAFIRSRMEYGSTILGNISKSLLNQLETVQNSALRYILGACRTTPVLSLQVESFIPPMKLRFLFLFMKWVLRYMYMPIGDQVASMLRFLDQEILLDFPFIAKAHQIFQMLNLPPLQRFPTPLLLCFPPHVDLSSSICLDLLSPDVNSMPCELTENCFQDFLKRNYPQHLQIYTDRSRSATGSVSAGLYLPSTNLATGWLLNQCTPYWGLNYLLY